jgi:two-component sensor histidine kinase
MVELARLNTVLAGPELRHAQRLVATWQTLADLCFSDLLLFAPVAGEPGDRFVVLAHVRPTTGQTLSPVDLVGTVVGEADRPLTARAFRTEEIVFGERDVLGSHDRAQVQSIPVRYDASTIAVVARESAITFGRRPGELERQYLDVFERFAHMIADGSFPFDRDDVGVEEAPRVGDGVIVFDADARIRFASPNAVSALHRMGIYTYTQGLRLSELGLDESAVQSTFWSSLPATGEFGLGDTAVLAQTIPLLEHGHLAGAIMLVRDVTELRRRDRMLITKDATIREIHHRVKNNLQTIAALLRLQGRRLQSDEARAALEASERRIRSIAIVHETLSREASDIVAFDEIVRPLARVVEETVSHAEQQIRFEVVGHVGDLPGELATPLAVVLNELMQNAVDHAFPALDGAAVTGHVRVTLERDDDRLVIDVVDDGVGLPPGFSLERSAGLGLSIVHTLVTSELSGSIELLHEGGTRVHVRVPVRSAEAGF